MPFRLRGAEPSHFTVGQLVGDINLGTPSLLRPVPFKVAKLHHQSLMKVGSRFVND